ncbi:MAG: sulfotransferase family protein, partial [Candidatus Binatia bacterium]
FRRVKRKAKEFVNKVLPYYQPSDNRKFGKTKDEFFPFGNRFIEYNFCELIHETECFVNAFQAHDGENDPYILGRRYLDRLFAIHCERTRRRFWVNKTPSLVRRLDLLHKMYPECGIVHIVRDGRDVALSTVSLREGPNTVRVAARRWKEMVLSGRRMLGSDKYLELRYEDLIAHPTQNMETVFAFLGLDVRAAGDLPGLKIYSHRERVWRDTMTQQAKADFAKEAGDLLIELGYEKDDRWLG